MSQGLVIDLFAGGGGASVGIEAALSRPVDIAINHDATALAVHKANHPETLHFVENVWKVRPEEATRGREVELLWASPDCKSFSRAKGGKPRDQKIRMLPWAVVRWARISQPRIICLENVGEFRDWGPLDAAGKVIPSRKGESFRRWLGELRRLGYAVEHRLLDASHYGAPTRRRRLFLVARRDGLPIRWPAPTHGGLGLHPLRAAAECIDWSIPCPSIFDRKKPLAPATLRRIAQGIRRFVLDSARPFIVRYNSGEFRGQGLGEPLSTIDTSNRFGLVAPTLIQTGFGEREGQRPRCLDIRQPLGTIVAGGVKHRLVSAFLTKHYGGMVGVPFDGRPLDTITAKDHHALTAVRLGEPGRAAEVRAFLTAYYSGPGEKGQSLAEPLRTITTRDRLGLVTVEGADYAITDIGMRMLEPAELLRAQFGRYAASYDLSAAKKTAQVRLVGNSVCPEVAEAVIAANLTNRVPLASDPQLPLFSLRQGA